MRLVTYLLIGLLIILLAGAGYYYIGVHQPMAQELARFKQGQPEFERAKRELKSCQDREKQDTGWTGPVASALRTGLAAEITEGKAEVVVSGNRIVANIAESALFTPHSVTFAKDSQRYLSVLTTFLKDIKDKVIFIGDATVPAPAQGRGRKRIPPKDARTLASGRALELVKYLVKNGVPEDTLVCTAYPSKMAERGFKLTAEKVVILIASPVTAPATSPAAATTGAKAAPSGKVSPTQATAPQIKTIPISTVPPKKVQ
jgi:hypothetical protein